MTPLIGLILSAITAAISAAPQAVELVENGKALFGTLFNNGLITKDIQDKLNEHIEAHAEAVSNDKVPPGWEVDADPES